VKAMKQHRLTLAPNEIGTSSLAVALGGIELFRGVRAEVLETLMKRGHVGLHAAGEVLVHPGAVAAVYVLLSGEMRLYCYSFTGSELTIARYGLGEIFGLAHLEPSTLVRSYLQVTLEDTVIFQIPVEYLRAIIEGHACVGANVAYLLGAKLREARERVEYFAFGTVSYRLQNTLLQLSASTTDRTVMARHDELAALIGVSREQVTRALRALKDQGIVDFQPHHRGIRILDHEALRRSIDMFTPM
jgi:CRP/FNR family cyclic AMP-dependent transcriptional regulator